MKNLVLVLLLFTLHGSLFAQGAEIKIVESNEGTQLMVDGEALMINGMNWDYFPIGTNYTYIIWEQSDEVIMAALDSEMSLLRDMGVNVIRTYTGIQGKWITYIYENYGIYTMLNHAFGRYGTIASGSWLPTDYADTLTQELLISQVKELAVEYQNTPGLLLYLLGNENNYGLYWAGAETEDIPEEDNKSIKAARAMYKLFNEAALQMKDIDKKHPIALCNGDLKYLDLIAEECAAIDIFGTNIYRGMSFSETFQQVQKTLHKPCLLTEFGADAYNVLENQEDQLSQAYYLVENWKEIYANASGMGQVGNAIGGFTFQFSDGWWKFGQTTNLDKHDTNASWSNGGYFRDYKEGENNMNEEWFGICAKGPTNDQGLYHSIPRAAYYALMEVHKFNPYEKGMTLKEFENHFIKIDLKVAEKRAKVE